MVAILIVFVHLQKVISQYDGGQFVEKVDVNKSYYIVIEVKFGSLEISLDSTSTYAH